MKTRLYFSVLVIFWLNCFQAGNASVIDDSGPNPLIVGKAFGFMLFGNDGFMNQHRKPCCGRMQSVYELSGGAYSHAVERIYISYDLNKKLAVGSISA